MARAIETIQQTIVNTLVATAAAAGLPQIRPEEWSDYDYRQLLTFIMATSQSTLEQLWDAFRGDVEKLIVTAPPQTGAWMQQQMLRFQYDSANPQIVQLDTSTFAPYYPNVNKDYQIIKYCSVAPGAFGSVSIKCAKYDSTTDGPAPLSPDEKSAALNYLNTIAVPGIRYELKTEPCDKIYIDATIYYKGQYSSVIFDSVKAAIKNYLATIPFDGAVLLSKLVDAIQNVPGVNDVVLNDVVARAEPSVYGSGTSLVTSKTTLQRSWNTAAGYIIPENTSGHELINSLHFEAQ